MKERASLTIYIYMPQLLKCISYIFCLCYYLVPMPFTLFAKFQAPPRIISPFLKPKDEDNNNESKINDSMKAVKKMIGQTGRTRTEKEAER